MFDWVLDTPLAGSGSKIQYLKKKIVKKLLTLLWKRQEKKL